MVSIIIPTYNRADMLRKAIDSVINQSCQDFEIIIIDDGSTDNTEDIVAHYNDNRITYLKRPHTGIISENRNIGLKHAQAEYIAFLDSDDIWHPLKLERQIELLSGHDVGYTFCNISVENDGSTDEWQSLTKFIKGREQPFKANLLDEIIFNRLAIYISSLMIKRSVLSDVIEFDTERSISEMDFIGRMAVDYLCYIDPRSWLTIKKHHGNTSGKDYELLFDEKITLSQKLLSKNKISKRDYKKSLALHYYALASVLTKPESIRTALIKCIKNRPLFLKAYYQMARKAY
ncbi:MAG: glycosyltransferase family 2 protein [Bacteroidota bacterium]